MNENQNWRKRGLPFDSVSSRSKGGKRQALSLDTQDRPSTPERSSDPYNTTGTFDRKNNWTRVGKR